MASQKDIFGFEVYNLPLKASKETKIRAIKEHKVWLNKKHLEAQNDLDIKIKILEK